GTPAVTTRGMKEPEMEQIAQLIDEALTARADDARLTAIRGEVRRLCARFPIYPELLRDLAATAP
ncbi:MAG TPA: serine hydroxymethyltransferase, partial [Elusimicrobia bacterium]|nr:serine hydroxymethyltransferase [Elusimicrobiota bacterium]